MVLKITQKDCDAAYAQLNKDKGGENRSLIIPLVEKTDMVDVKESVAAVADFVTHNMSHFIRAATLQATQYARKRGISLPHAITELVTQLQVRLVMYVVNRCLDTKQFEDQFSLDFPEEKS